MSEIANAKDLCKAHMVDALVHLGLAYQALNDLDYGKVSSHCVIASSSMQSTKEICDYIEHNLLNKDPQ